MKRFIILTVLLSLASTILAGNSNLRNKEFRGHIVDLQNDTTFCYFELNTNRRRKIDPFEFHSGIVGYFESGKRLIVYPKKVKSIHIHDTDEGTQNFYSQKIEKHWSYSKLISYGRLKLYKSYKTFNKSSAFVIQMDSRELQVLTPLLWIRELRYYFREDPLIQHWIEEEDPKWGKLKSVIKNLNSRISRQE